MKGNMHTEITSTADVSTVPAGDCPRQEERAEPVVFGIGDAVCHLGIPLLIFGAVLLVLMVAMSFLLSPDRFPVVIGLKSVKMGELTQEYRSLQEQTHALKEERARLLSLVPTPILHQLSLLRKDTVSIGATFQKIETIRSDFAQPLHDPIQIASINYDSALKTIVLRGTVRDALSIQVLASFVDELRNSGSFIKVSEPEYRIESPETSPFTLTLSLPS